MKREAVYTRLCSFWAAVCVWVLISASAAQATTILSVSGPNSGEIAVQLFFNQQASAVGFLTSIDYINVDISISLTSFSAVGEWDLDSYITTQIGPGTTIADEIANASQHVSIPSSPFSPPLLITPYTLFSGLTLPAGTYYLTVRGTYVSGGSAGWIASPNADLNVVADTGASIVAANLGGIVIDPYPPASLFLDSSSGTNGSGLWFTVTGDAVEGVPEPYTIALCFGGLLVLVGGQLRRRRH